MKKNPGVSVYTEGGGSATGTEALANGKVDISATSRPINPTEAQKLAANFGAIGMSVLVAKDALSVFLNPENPVKNLTLEQIKDIFTGNIKNWQEVNGQNEPILLINRMPNSGTFKYFQAHVLDGKSYDQNAKTCPTTRAVVKEVANNRNAIGYGGMAYSSNIIHCQINNIEPTEKNVREDRYPITRYLYLYTVNTPHGQVRKFIDWVLSIEGQRIVEKAGYFPIWKESNSLVQ